MITENDLKQAIAECQGERNPNANTCIKLAAFYTIQDHLGNPDVPASYAAAPVPCEGITFYSESDFARAVYGKDANSVLAVVDDLMQALQALSPRLYHITMRKFEKV